MIYEKLAQIQAQLFVPKGQHNDFGKYNYRSCEDILKAVKPLCAQCGCVPLLDNKIVQCGAYNYIEATATLFDTETGETVSVTAQAREDDVKKGMDGMQISGSASSYARKYALAGLFCIDNEKDSDATNETPKDDQTSAAEKDDAEVKTLLMQFVKRHKMNEENKEKICKAYKVKELKDLTADNCRHYIRALEKSGGSIYE